ncbi:MAG: hypothetical protein Q9M48_08855 [Rhodobacterales bacterium]|nr:hypothetical protein [Rhodobacterales bacterium]
MLTESIATRLAALPAKAREIAESQLRAEGVLGNNDALEHAFEQDPAVARKDTLDCLSDCYDAYDKTVKDCKTDACKAGAAISLSKCKKGC